MGDRPTVSRVVALFLLSQIFLIVHHKPLVSTILNLLTNFEENRVLHVANSQGNLAAQLEDNITDEEKELRMSSTSATPSESYKMTPHLETILDSLNPSENDYEALFGLTLLYAMGQNKGGNACFITPVEGRCFMNVSSYLGINDEVSFWEAIEWKPLLISKLMLLLSAGCQMTSKIRPVTVDLVITLLQRIAVPGPPAQHGLDDKNFAILEQAKEESIMVARTFFKV